MKALCRPDPPLTRSVGFLLVPGFSMMSYVSAIEPCRAANHLSGAALYAWPHFSADGSPVVSSTGLSFHLDHKAGDELALDMLLVFAGGNAAHFHHAPTLAWLRALARRGTAIGGISGGAYLLARAGVLNGRRCTIHWEHQPAFCEEFPALSPTGNLYEVDRGRLTCSGGIAALDMMRDVIERDHGAVLGSAVCEWFLHTNRRTGTDPQRMDLQARTGVSNRKLLAAIGHMEANLAEPKSNAALAAMSGVSVRHLERLFRTHLQRSARSYYLELRLRRARALLRDTTLPLLEIAVACGFQSGSYFASTYKRHFHIQPHSERIARRREG